MKIISQCRERRDGFILGAVFDVKKEIRGKRFSLAWSMVLALAVALVPVVVATQSAHAQTFSVLYSCTGGTDGGYPLAGLVRDTKVNLYSPTAGDALAGNEVRVK